jgi:transcriptional regulator with XRE-family HTH domain
MATDFQKKVFAETLRDALEKRGMSGRGLARAVGVSPGAASHWLQGRSVPGFEMVESIEQTAGLEEGTLSRLVGYIPTSVQDRAMANVLAGFEDDPRLDDRGRRLLAGMRRELVRQREVEAAYATLRAAAERLITIPPDRTKGVATEVAEALEDLRGALQATPPARPSPRPQDATHDDSPHSRTQEGEQRA